MAESRITQATPHTAKQHQHARSPRSKRRRSSKNAVHPDTQHLLNWAAGASKRAVVPFATEFIRRDDSRSPPLARLLRAGGGRGGEVSLKLYLTMNLFAAHSPFDIRPLPARVWSEMLGLPKPETNGARRINEALTHLEQQKLIRLSERRQGKPAKAQLLSHTGSGEQYSRPTRHYANLPVRFWQNCWIVTLSGRAIALLLVLLDLQRGKDRAEGAWIRPDKARRYYGLSEDTWSRAVKELSEAGIVSVTREKHGERWEWVRMRNKYRVDIKRL